MTSELERAREYLDEMSEDPWSFLRTADPVEVHDHFFKLMRMTEGALSQSHLWRDRAQRAAEASGRLAEAVAAVWESMRLGEDIDVIEEYLRIILEDPGVGYYLVLARKDDPDT